MSRLQLNSLQSSPNRSKEEFGGINYSPNHASKTQASNNSRNINFKNLLLEISPQNLTRNHSSPHRSVPLTLTIPDEEDTSNHNDLFDSNLPLPYHELQNDLLPSSKIISQILKNPTVNASDTRGSLSSLKSPFSSLPHYANSNRLKQNLSLRPHDLDSDYQVDMHEIHDSNEDDPIIAKQHDPFSSPNSTQNGQLPAIFSQKSQEELQESTAINAYPDGPANVLDSILYLYSDPNLSNSPIDIKDYDLVLNVARECKDLGSNYKDNGGKGKYVHFAWSHTSSILDQLLDITQQLSEVDRPGKKALIHCQCGVLRSACVVVAYFMVKFKLSVNEAYELLKTGTKNKGQPINYLIGQKGHFVEACEKICPNMNLIFELMDFGEQIRSKVALSN